MLMIDIDRFKRLNDTFGHAAATTCCARSAARSAGAVREDDVPARFGGEEFAVLLRNPARRSRSRSASASGGRRRRSTCGAWACPAVSVSVGVAVAEDAGRAARRPHRRGGPRALPGEARGRDRVVAA